MGEDNRVRAALDAVQEKIDWQAGEIERLGDVIRAQDAAAKSVTARFGIKHSASGPTFIVTCPSGDEAALMRAMFAGLASMAWTGFQMACEGMGGTVREGAEVLFGTIGTEGEG